LSIDSGDSIALSSAYTELLQTVESAKAEVRRHVGDRQEIPLRPIARIGQALDQSSINHTWGTVARALGEARGELEQVEVAVTSVSQEAEVAADSLEAIRARAADVETLAQENDVHPELRDFIVLHINYIRRATLLYQLDGVAGLRATLDAALGAVNSRPKVARKGRRGPSRAAWLGFLSVLADIGQVVSTSVVVSDLMLPRQVIAAKAIASAPAIRLISAPADATSVTPQE